MINYFDQRTTNCLIPFINNDLRVEENSVCRPTIKKKMKNKNAKGKLLTQISDVSKES